MKKQTKILIVIIVLAATAAIVGSWRVSQFARLHPNLSTDSEPQQRPDPDKQPQSEQHPTTPESLQSPDVSQSQGGTTTTSKLVRFESDRAKDVFIAHNRLQPEQLEYISALGVYRVSASTDQTEGSKVYNSQRYRVLLTPNDTFYSSQWHFAKVHAPATWDNTVGDSSVTVAVIDTGFALEHQDLDDAWYVNDGESGVTESEGAEPNCTSRALSLDKSCNNIDDDADGYVDNRLGWDFANIDNNVQTGETDPLDSATTHGTLVSGLIAAESSNAQGVAGMSWHTKILPLQALTDLGEGDTVSVALAIHYAVTHGAQVINLSLGSDGDDPLVAEQIEYAHEQGVVVVAAAGNENEGTLSYPANYPTVIAVGATDTADVRASFSNYGSNLALVAPGTSICSTSWSSANQTTRYTCGSAGTSFSSPIVAGAAALLLAQNTTLTPTQVKSALTATATKVAGMSGQSFTTRYGYGRLNMYEALKSVSYTAPSGQPLSTRQVSLAAISGHTRPELNSTCVSPVPNAVCRVRAIRTTDNAVAWLDDGVGAPPDYNLYWNASAVGMSSGSWLIQTYVESEGKRSMVSQELLTVSP
ncbi:S8 family serine peptidase [bacterium]|nr:S8 family serine peptidase [bacterium]